jgi:hypothetical protein
MPKGGFDDLMGNVLGGQFLREIATALWYPVINVISSIFNADSL